MAGWGTYQCYSIVTEYFQYPKKVTIEIIEETKVPFPAVTVCNLNPLPARSSVADHQTWSSFVQIEDENSEASKCEDVEEYVKRSYRRGH
ncbi:hypothetical protein O3P69_009891 [Scylla paramamosain]|uniref:Uncharacterized protein n=1 Tax=Scylla paramamosain TaxID=85552 RepID=A0AAW0SPC3_SCYPA